MIKTTIWRPDTCGCEIHYEWNDTDPQASRIHTAVASTKVCDVHKGMSVPVHYDTVLRENQGKNEARGVIAENSPTLTYDKDVDGVLRKEFLVGKEPTFSFDKDRNLLVNLSTLDAADKTQMQAVLDSELGVKTVTIQ